MRKSLTSFVTVAVVGLALGLAPQAQALIIDDPGVVGSVDTGTQSSPVANEIDWAQHLLDMAVSTLETVDGNVPLDGVTEIYQTGINDYSGLLTGGFQIGVGDNDPVPAVSSYEWVLAKYDGQSAGYVLFNVADMLGGSLGSVPEYSYSIWGANEEQYRVSHVTGFGRNVPDGGVTMLLLGMALMGVEGLRRKLS